MVTDAPAPLVEACAEIAQRLFLDFSLFVAGITDDGDETAWSEEHHRGFQCRKRGGSCGFDCLIGVRQIPQIEGDKADRFPLNYLTHLGVAAGVQLDSGICWRIEGSGEALICSCKSYFLDIEPKEAALGIGEGELCKDKGVVAITTRGIDHVITWAHVMPPEKMRI